MEHESVRSFKGYLCLIQVSTHSHDFLVDLLAIADSSFVGSVLGERVLASPSIVKVLHGGSSDKVWLRQDFAVTIVNVFDTQDCFQALGGSKLALHHLWRTFCGFHMEADTKAKHQTGNWSQRPLPADMLEYAACDSRFLIYLRVKLLTLALAGPDSGTRKAVPGIKKALSLKQLNKLHAKMQKIGGGSSVFTTDGGEDTILQSCSRMLSKVAKSDDSKPDLASVCRFRMLFEARDSVCREVDVSPEHMVDVKYLYWAAKEPEKVEKVFADAMLETVPQDVVEIKKGVFSKLIDAIRKINLDNSVNDQDNVQLYENITSEINLIQRNKETMIQKQKDKDIRRKNVIEKFSIKKPIYENCQILAPDGEILCKCDKQKVEWYLTKELATIVKEEPLTIKLNFEPNGRGISSHKGDDSIDNQYYVDYKKNQCVVCGVDDKYMRFQIVPSKYRAFFPEKYKSHRSHDILLLCFD